MVSVAKKIRQSVGVFFIVVVYVIAVDINNSVMIQNGGKISCNNIQILQIVCCCNPDLLSP